MLFARAKTTFKQNEVQCLCRIRSDEREVFLVKKLLFGVFLLLGCAGTVFAAEDVTSVFFSTTGSSMEHCISYDFSRAKMTLVWEAPGVTRSARVSPAQYARLCSLCDELGLKNWDGFSGTDSGVLDGEGFNMSVEYAGGPRVHARGYMRFPQGYRMAKDALFSFFEGVLRDAPQTKKKY
jgi:hypothetical protein